MSRYVAGVVARTPMEAIIHGSWWADIDPAAGKATVKEAIKNLPTAQFLRTSLVAHYLTRAYWTHSGPEDRLVLLDCADDLVRKTGGPIDKGKLKRLFVSDKKADDPLDRPSTEEAPVHNQSRADRRRL